MAATALAESTRAPQATVEALPNGLIVIDPDGRIDMMNAEAERILGYDRAELVGRSVELLLPKQQRDRFERLRARFMRGAERHARGSRLEISAIRKDGSSVPIDVSVSRMTQQGRVIMLAAIVDVTEQKSAEQQLNDRAEELSRANAELAQFAYIASHDLQEPLRMVSSYLDLLRRRYRGKLDAEADEFIGYAIDGAVRMKRLINDLLGYARTSDRALNIETVDTDALVSSVLHTLGHRIQETGAEITRCELPSVQGDSIQLERLFMRLIVNALKYRSDKRPTIHVDASPCDGFWQFSVTDNGIGIDPRFKDQIFEMFKRLHARDAYGGTGIGLAVCKVVVERHGGRIWVEPARGGGSVFLFTLPVAPTVEAST